MCRILFVLCSDCSMSYRTDLSMSYVRALVCVMYSLQPRSSSLRPEQAWLRTLRVVFMNATYKHVYLPSYRYSVYCQEISVHRSTGAAGQLGTQTRLRFTGRWFGQKPQPLFRGPNQAQPTLAAKIYRGLDGAQTAHLTCLCAMNA